MGGFIFLADGRAYAPARWAYDLTIRSIASALGQSSDDHALQAWLAHQTCEEHLMGLGSVDVRELAPSMARRFIEAIPKAVAIEQARGSEGWHDASFFPGWLKSIQELCAMIDSVERGEPVEALNPYARDPAAPWPAAARISGPGWPEWLRAAPSDELTPLADRIETVDWSNTPLTDADFSAVTHFPKATRFFVYGTKITGAALVHLQALPDIECLWALETGVRDADVQVLRVRFPEAEIRVGSLE